MFLDLSRGRFFPFPPRFPDRSMYLVEINCNTFCFAEQKYLLVIRQTLLQSKNTPRPFHSHGHSSPLHVNLQPRNLIDDFDIPKSMILLGSSRKAIARVEVYDNHFRLNSMLPGQPQCFPPYGLVSRSPFFKFQPFTNRPRLRQRSKSH